MGGTFDFIDKPSRYQEDEIDQIVEIVAKADTPNVGDWTKNEPVAYAIRAVVTEAYERINDGVTMVYQNMERVSTIEDAKRLVDFILQTQHEED